LNRTKLSNLNENHIKLIHDNSSDRYLKKYSVKQWCPCLNSIINLHSEYVMFLDCLETIQSHHKKINILFLLEKNICSIRNNFMSLPLKFHKYILKHREKLHGIIGHYSLDYFYWYLYLWKLHIHLEYYLINLQV
jgi:hypothetical protein